VIGWLSGVVVEAGPEGLILDVGGVGYEVSVVPGMLGSAGRAGDSLEIWVHTHATSESPAPTFFGFVSSEQRRVFRLLLKVKGIGPKVAQNVVSQLGGDGVVEAVQTGDLKRLTSVSGVGKKTAQQVILDLAGQLGGIETVLPQPTGVSAEVTSALTNLGFKRVQVDRALRTLRDRGEGEGEFDDVLRRALSMLREL